MLPWPKQAPPNLMADVRDTSLAKLVRDERLGLVLRGDLLPGQRINEPDVAARLRVSRVPVRVAVRELESSGLVSARKHAGVFVRMLAPKEVADFYGMRGTLDGHAGQRAAGLPASKRRVLVQRLTAFLRDMTDHARQHNVQSYYASDLAFHWAVVQAADNDVLARTYRGIAQQLHLLRLKNLSRDVGMQVSRVEHEQIVAAISHGDPERCQSLLAARGHGVSRLPRRGSQPRHQLTIQRP